MPPQVLHYGSQVSTVPYLAWQGIQHDCNQVRPGRLGDDQGGNLWLPDHRPSQDSQGVAKVQLGQGELDKGGGPGLAHNQSP
jgi:hypothetical protein